MTNLLATDVGYLKIIDVWFTNIIIFSNKKVIATDTQYYKNASIYGYVKHFFQNSWISN